MGDYYHHFLSSMSGMDGHSSTSPDEMSRSPIHGTPLSITPSPMSMPYHSIGYFPGFSDPSVLNATKPQKGRRKSASGIPAGIDHVKHRRTRSGCFMCRSRRVKCDETRPVCERCRKGNRECVYPDPPAPKGSAGHASRSKDSASSTQPTSPTSSNEDDDDDDNDMKLETIPDEDETQDALVGTLSSQTSRTMSTTSSNLQLYGARHSSETPSQEGNKSSSPSISTVTSGSMAAHAVQASDFSNIPDEQASWSKLPPDFRHYLNFYLENITNYHYCLVNDGDDFFKTILPQIAMRSEPLLNALVGFSAYHVTLQNPKGKLQDFLQYYTKSVTLLLSSLKRNDTHNISTLLTILQLATIEEYLGDWVNLMGHQKAAFEILTKIFTPQTIVQTPVGRMCLGWYARFDTFVALMGGFPTDLPRDWFTTLIEFNQSKTATSSKDSLRWKIDQRSSRLRLITYDMSLLYARGSRGQISPADFITEHDRLTTTLVEWKDNWDPDLSDAAYLVMDFPNQQPLDPDDIVDPYAPGLIYNFPLFISTLIYAEWHSIMIMHKSQSTNIPPDVLFVELRRHAYVICQHFEAIELWPLTPAGVLISLQACLSIAALFLPRDELHHMWLRRKFATLDVLGYIHPTVRRKKMAELFREPSCVHWWLPNGEGLSPILQSVRNFADERNAAAVTAQQENLREIRHIFAKLDMSAYAEGEVRQGNETENNGMSCATL